MEIYSRQKMICVAIRIGVPPHDGCACEGQMSMLDYLGIRFNEMGKMEYL